MRKALARILVGVGAALAALALLAGAALLWVGCCLVALVVVMFAPVVGFLRGERGDALSVLTDGLDRWQGRRGGRSPECAPRLPPFAERRAANVVALDARRRQRGAHTDPDDFGGDAA